MAGNKAVNANSAVTVIEMGRMSDNGSNANANANANAKTNATQQPVVMLNPEIDEILQTPAAVLVPEAQK